MLDFMTPLRWKIAAGYLVFILVTLMLWKDLAYGWSVLMTLLAPVFTFFAALLALKFSVVLTALATFLVAFLNWAVSLLIAVSKMGIIKGLFLPWLLAGLQWMHGKSAFLQKWVGRIYLKGKNWGTRVFNWWQSKNKVDRVLLLGFLGPLILVVSFAVLLKRFVYVFISKKAAEQVVQKATKATVKNFNKIPVIGKVPNQIKSKATEIKTQRDKKLNNYNAEETSTPDVNKD